MLRARDLLQQILLGGRLDDKLAGLGLRPSALDWESGWDEPFEVPAQPGREGALAPRESPEEKESFPRRKDLLGPESRRHRGRVLHYFANHELLAIETMAFTLLRFPEAPVEFKQGVFRILQEEQDHLSRYLARMRDYGVEMGEVPLNLYFWNSLRTLESPMDFVTRMSLTFEQANLDFALEYARIFRDELGDAETAALLQKVHDDEITHVAHGLYWFNLWRAEGVPPDATASEWEDYRRRLPFPMSARRARGGTAFFAGESRRRAGFSPEYIESVRITGGSRGRVPELWLYNPQCEIESAPGYQPSRALRDKIVDFEPVLFWLAQESDVVVQEREPPREWLRHVFEWRGELPEWVASVGDVDRPVERLRPWGWGPSAFAAEAALTPHLRRRQPVAREVFSEQLLSKAWWKEQLRTPGAVVESAESLAAWIASRPAGERAWIVKSAHSTSGRGHRVLRVSDPFSSKVSDTDVAQALRGGTAVVEPYFDKVIDFSVQYERAPDGRIRAWEPRLFETDGRHRYVRSFLGVAAEGGRRELHRLLETHRAEWQPLHERVGEQLAAVGYSGPYGIDGLIARTATGSLQVVPVIEVNVRLTFGRLAHELERCLRRRGIPSGELRVIAAEETAALQAAQGERLLWVTPPDAPSASRIAVVF